MLVRLRRDQGVDVVVIDVQEIGAVTDLAAVISPRPVNMISAVSPSRSGRFTSTPLLKRVSNEAVGRYAAALMSGVDLSSRPKTWIWAVSQCEHCLGQQLFRVSSLEDDWDLRWRLEEASICFLCRQAQKLSKDCRMRTSYRWDCRARRLDQLKTSISAYSRRIICGDA